MKTSLLVLSLVPANFLLATTSTESFLYENYLIVEEQEERPQYDSEDPLDPDYVKRLPPTHEPVKEDDSSCCYGCRCMPEPKRGASCQCCSPTYHDCQCGRNAPKQKKCISSECYTPAYHDLQCDCGFFVLGDFLYWYARETNLSYALEIVTTPESFPQADLLKPVPAFAPKKTHHVDTKWDPGFRVGIGTNFSCDGWDSLLQWTYYKNENKDAKTVTGFGPDPSAAETDPGITFLLNQWFNASFMRFNEPMVFNKVSAKWQLHFNQLDWEIGRKYWLSPCFTMRPYLGLRGAWIKTEFGTSSIFAMANTISPSQFTSKDGLYKDDFTNRSWGGGILGGIQPNWHICQNFILFGNVEMALIWGKFEAQKKENYRLDEVNTAAPEPTFVAVLYKNKADNDFFQMTPILDLAIG
ncbi:MAG: hypothetical protein KR126chlam3_01183 [Chlamydiae bacterium]|nr:hypothetical protein [Chlamydiota bacterium]